MHRLQEVVRLHRLGASARRIGRQLRMGRETIRQYLTVFARAGALDGPADALPPLEVLRELALDAKPALEAAACISSSVERWKDEIVRLRAKGAGPTSIHDHLRVNESEYSGSLSAIKRLCLRLDRADGPRAVDVAIPVETAPGEVAQVDFGYAGKRYDPVRGVLRKSWVFVMTLCFSRRMYCDLVFDQTVVFRARLPGQ